MQRIFLLLILLSGVAVGQVAQDTPFRFEFEELAPGVWAGVRPDGPRFPVMGNTTFVISDEGVVVFDGGGMPAMAEQIIDKLRSISDKPVSSRSSDSLRTSVSSKSSFAIMPLRPR